jgi:hypothetical protein
MILHLVLFRPKATLTDEQRRTLIETLQNALGAIPGIRHARVGRRRNLGRFYDAQNAQDFPFVATIEFATEADLLSYLDHPAHRSLGEQFYLTAESALAFDFEWLDRVEDLLTAADVRT